jgi:ABC-type transport system involved in multi-copper enzyme maturation permease subunit
MPFWPVAAREARSAARAPRTYAWRAVVTAIGIAIVPISLWMSRAAPSQGRAVFIAVAGMAFIYCLFGGVLRTADSIAEEKRENTLGLLFLTDLKVGDVISGKLLASTASLFFGLLALMPLLAIPVLLGGVTRVDLAQMALCLVNSLFFSISLGFLVSTFFRQGWVTISVAMAAMLMLVFCVPIAATSLPFWLRLSIFALSPATTFGTIIGGYPDQPFWQTLLAVHLLAWLNILCAAHYLPKYWQERPRGVKAQRRWEKWRRLRFGGSKTRQKFRTRLLNRNPLFWLSGREQVSSMGLMTFLMLIVALSMTSSWQQVLCALVALHGTLLVRMASAASHALAEDRKSGALELLLATRLSVADLLKGRWMALGRQFFGPVLIVTIWHLFTIVWLQMQVMSPHPTISLALFTGLLACVLAWVATGWYGMWMGLRARHPVAAIWGTLAAVVLVPWIVLAGGFSVLAFFQMVPDYGFAGQRNFEATGCFLWALYLFALNAWTSRRVRSAFREAATDRFSDTQPIDWRPAWRVTWKVAAIALTAIASVWLGRIYINFSGERELAATLAAHPNFSLSGPTPPFVADNQNLAHWGFLEALNDRNTVDPAYGGLRVNMGDWRRGVRFGGGGAAVEDEERLVQLHAAARERPFIYFLPISTNPFAAQYTLRLHEIPLRLAARAERRLNAGEHPVDDVLLALRFANSLTNDPRALLTRRLMIDTAIQPVYDGILDGWWTDADLQTLQRAFAQSDSWAHFELWRNDLMKEVLEVVAQAPKVKTRFPQMMMIGGYLFYMGQDESRPTLPGKIQSEQAAFIRLGLEKFTPMADPVRRTARALYFPPVIENGFQQRVNEALHSNFSEAVSRFAPTQAAIDQVVIACAIERFRLANGRLPGSLKELSPKFLTAIPHDIVGGEPYRYRPTTNGYLLYSIALDGIDHRGAPEKREMIRGREQTTPGDWVWIYRK